MKRSKIYLLVAIFCLILSSPFHSQAAIDGKSFSIVNEGSHWYLIPALFFFGAWIGILGNKPSSIHDFKIGDEFVFPDSKRINRVTDVGSRTIAFIVLYENQDASWHNGPPYAVAEYVLAVEEMADIEKI